MSDDNKKPVVPDNPQPTSKPEPPRMPSDRIEKGEDNAPILK